ncbi:unnamed protein product [Rangifer tarandus platyrhynchus]|uniref:Uncharacterized protein n=1 Tax=Rangifer tarandus platyrhynchus TaxID=3082113 RepID=A0AC59ZA98_RANTA
MPSTKATSPCCGGDKGTDTPPPQDRVAAVMRGFLGCRSLRGLTLHGSPMPRSPGGVTCVPEQFFGSLHRQSLSGFCDSPGGLGPVLRSPLTPTPLRTFSPALPRALGRWEADPANTSAAQSLPLPVPRVPPSSPGPLAWAGPILPGLPRCGLRRLSPSSAPTIGLGRPGDPRHVGQSSGCSLPTPPPLELQPWPSHPF